MADILATLIMFQQFLFEFGPFFLAAWFTAGTLGLAVDGTGQLLAVWW